MSYKFERNGAADMDTNAFRVLTAEELLFVGGGDTDSDYGTAAYGDQGYGNWGNQGAPGGEVASNPDKDACITHCTNLGLRNGSFTNTFNSCMAACYGFGPSASAGGSGGSCFSGNDASN